MVSKKLTAIVGATCLAIGLTGGLLIGTYLSSPKKAYTVFDFNHDDTTDLVIEKKSGNEVRLYGSEFGDENNYSVYTPKPDAKK